MRRFKFKYQQDMDMIKNQFNCDCPDKDLNLIDNYESFRFVFEDINHKRNFLPQLIDKPTRFLKNNGKTKCNYLNLSMYSKFDKAKERYYQLSNTFPNIGKSIGTHIANGVLDFKDGMVTDEDQTTHFGLYEFADADLKKKFNILEKL